MKTKLFLLGALASALSFGPVAAADLPSYKAPPAYAPPVFTWSGWHFGVNAGYGGGTYDTVTNILAFPAVAAPGFAATVQTSHNTSGFIGGVQNGFLWQLSNNVVVGYESDIQFSDVGGSQTNALGFGGGRQRLAWFGTERLRFGYAFGRFLPYITGGLVYGRIRADGTQFSNGFLFPGSTSSTHAGWTVGAGLEYAFWGNVSVKAEYLYTQMQGAQGAGLGIPVIAGLGPAYRTYTTPTFGTHIGRVGLNYTADLGALLGLPGL
jgi:outer membrane immunogenic protein